MKIIFTLLFILCLGAVEAQTTHSGSWTEVSHEVEGSWKIIKEGTDLVLKFDDDFDTKKAPDLKIFLSKLTSDQVNKKNATTGSALIAELKEYDGSQTFRIPKSIQISDYKTLLIHCEEYGVLWSVSSLK